MKKLLSIILNAGLLFLAYCLTSKYIFEDEITLREVISFALTSIFTAIMFALWKKKWTTQLVRYTLKEGFAIPIKEETDEEKS